MNTSLLQQTIARLAPLDAKAVKAARARQDILTKPQGSLGRLEDVSVQLAGIQGTATPRIGRKVVVVAAGDHGVTREGVSAYPSEVTPQMVLNFLRGGAAINVFARNAGCDVMVVDAGIAVELPPHPSLRVARIGPGTANMAHGPAMSHEQASQALEAGIRIANELVAEGVDLLATGDMGIGNTTSASAITSVITGAAVARTTGRGTGVTDEGLQRKIAVIEEALRVNHPDAQDPLDILAKVGGFEIGVLAGVTLGAAAARRPVVLDGFISGAAGLIACGFSPRVRHYLIASHRSVEQGHKLALQKMRLKPLLDMHLRLGEGTGAVLAMPVIDAAWKALAEMATFAEAGVSDKETERPE